MLSGLYRSGTPISESCATNSSRCSIPCRHNIIHTIPFDQEISRIARRTATQVSKALHSRASSGIRSALSLTRLHRNERCSYRYCTAYQLPHPSVSLQISCVLSIVCFDHCGAWLERLASLCVENTTGMDKSNHRNVPWTQSRGDVSR